MSTGRGREEAFRRQHPQILEGLMEIARIQSSESSNAIEHITAPANRVAELVQDKTSPQNRPEEEIAGYRKVLDAIHASAEHIPVKTSIVLQFHRDLYSFTATPGGHLKNTQNEAARFDKGGQKIEVIFKGVSPVETPAAMDELHEGFVEAVKDDGHAPLLLAGAYVFDFLMIHPFNDGNGRLSRLLTLLLLYRHDLWPWLNYFLGILNAAYKEFEARAGELTGGRGSKAMRIRQFVQSRASSVFTFDEAQRALPDISADHIRTELRKLRDAGIVESPGRGRREWRRLKPVS